MSKIVFTRLKQGYRTMKFPDGPPPPMPDRFRGKLIIDRSQCLDGCTACADACPTEAISLGAEPKVDLGKCLFCTDCTNACPTGAIHHSNEYRLASRGRQSLIQPVDRQEPEIVAALDTKLRRLFGRSLKLRQVSAGGCNGCESDVNVLSTIGWDLSRFGIQFVASPRHADGLLITGPITPNMVTALKKTWDAVPEPKIVIATGACAISGGPFALPGGVQSGVERFLKVDLFIPGCPPHPLTILDGILRLLGRIEDKKILPRKKPKRT